VEYHRKSACLLASRGGRCVDHVNLRWEKGRRGKSKYDLVGELQTAQDARPQGKIGAWARGPAASLENKQTRKGGTLLPLAPVRLETDRCGLRQEAWGTTRIFEGVGLLLGGERADARRRRNSQKNGCAGTEMRTSPEKYRKEKGREKQEGPAH